MSIADDTSPLAGIPLRECLLPFPRRAIPMLVVSDPLALLREGLPDREVYWAEIWPAGIALAEALLDGNIPVPASAGPVLDLGCGLGLTTVAAALAGGPKVMVVAADHEPRALALAAENARRNGVAGQVQTRRLDWREPYDGKHRLILVADCLYLPDAPWEVTAFLKRALEDAPDARAVVADPERWSARNFGLAARQAGFQIRTVRRAVPFLDRHGPVGVPVSGPPSDAEVRSGQPLEVVLYELRRG